MRQSPGVARNIEGESDEEQENCPSIYSDRAISSYSGNGLTSVTHWDTGPTHIILRPMDLLG